MSTPTHAEMRRLRAVLARSSFHDLALDFDAYIAQAEETERLSLTRRDCLQAFCNVLEMPIDVALGGEAKILDWLTAYKRERDELKAKVDNSQPEAWRCSCCGALKPGMPDSSWRCVFGHADGSGGLVPVVGWQHNCPGNHPMAGWFSARNFGGTERPEENAKLAAVLREHKPTIMAAIASYGSDDIWFDEPTKEGLSAAFAALADALK